MTTVRTVLIDLLLFSDTTCTEDLPTLIVGVSRMLERVSGHTETDQTLELIRRFFYPVTVVTTSLYSV